jgi:hypothetical protein
MKRNNSKDLTIIDQSTDRPKGRNKTSKWLLSIPEVMKRVEIARGNRTLEELAIASGVPVSVVHRSVSGIQFPNLGLLGYFGATGISIDSLVLKYPAKPSLEALQFQALTLSKEDQLRLVTFVLAHQQPAQ